MAIKDIEGLKAKKEKIEKLAQIVIEKSQDKWAPSPLFVQSREERKIEQMNRDIPEFIAKIKFGKTTYIKDKLYLIVKIPEYKFEKTFNQIEEGDWSEEFEIKMDKSNFESFYTTKINVEIYEKRALLKDLFKGKIEILPSGLKDHIEYNNKFKIDLEHKRKEEPTAEVTFRVRTPCREKEFITEIKPIFYITRIYPSFILGRENNNESIIKSDISQQKVTFDDLKINSSVLKPTKTITLKSSVLKPTNTIILTQTRL